MEKNENSNIKEKIHQFIHIFLSNITDGISNVSIRLDDFRHLLNVDNAAREYIVLLAIIEFIEEYEEIFKIYGIGVKSENNSNSNLYQPLKTITYNNKSVYIRR
jgi:hypothetical protein